MNLFYQILVLQKVLTQSFPGSLSMTNIGYNKIYDTNINEKILVNNFSCKGL